VEAAPKTLVSPRLLVGVPLAAIVVLIALVLGAAVLLGSSSGASCGTSATVGSLGKGVPKDLVPIYQQAAAKYRLGQRGPAMLASINWNETSFGTNTDNNTGSGAMGWMMFMPETWAAYGVDGNGDGTKDPYNKWDAIFAAAGYLAASGAPKDWYGAVFAYNHADWYVQRVFEDAERFEGNGGEVVVAAGSEACAASVTAPNEAVAKMVAEADRINGLELTYLRGGSHGLTPTPPNGPFDCSSAVSHLLQVAGYKNETMATPSFVSWGKAGPGKWVTLHNKPYGEDAHIFIEFSKDVTPASKRYWGTSGTNPGGGPGWIPESAFDAGYLSGFELRHPKGL
jgi:hypothetical protein